MKKPHIQPTFASLTEAELEQLATAVQRETYDAVRERICKPRSQGGLDLHFTSNSPLVRLHDKKNKLDLINARLCRECADHKKLTLTELNTFISMEKRAPEEVHAAILDATYTLVTEHNNTPTQLLALQRLADFPARAELRAQMAALRAQSARELSRLRNQTLAHRTQRMQITRAKEQRAQAKAQRDAEMHTHKINLDLRKFDLKFELAEFQKQIATERLNLQKHRADRLNSPSTLHGKRVGVTGSSTSDDFESTSDSNPYRSSSRREDNSHRPPIRILVDEDGEPFTRFPTPNPLPNHIVIKNRAYTKKLLAGLVDPDTWEELDAPTPASLAFARGEIHNEPLGATTPSSNGAINQPRTAANATPSTPDHGRGTEPASTQANISSEVFLPYPTSASPDNLTPPDAASSVENHGRATFHPCPISNSRDAMNDTKAAPADPNANDLEESQTQNSQPKIQNSASSAEALAAELAATVDRYTITRVREYIAHNQKYSPWPYRHSPPEYITEHRHCPCGHPCPCPTHESEEFGPFPTIFWKASPFGFLYRDCLRARNLPYREPKEYYA